VLGNLLPLMPSATSRSAFAGTKCLSGGPRKPSPWPVSLNGSSKSKAGCKLTRMRYFTNRSLVFWSFPFLVISSGCMATPECESIETRMAVLQFVSGDGNNPLVTYAAKIQRLVRHRLPPNRKIKKAKSLCISSVRR